MTDQDIQALENQFPPVSGSAFAAAREQVLKSGQRVLQSGTASSTSSFPMVTVLKSKRLNLPLILTSDASSPSSEPADPTAAHVCRAERFWKNSTEILNLLPDFYYREGVTLDACVVRGMPSPALLRRFFLVHKKTAPR